MPYDHKQIEKKWAKKWEEKGVYKLDPKALSERSESKWYNLMMFPYPSAEGLHVGNMYAFTGADFYGRFQAMQGHDVFEPIGLDGFGIHSENYALKIKKHPVELATVSQKHFYDQLAKLGNRFNWDQKLETYDPEYYKWTQWLFVQMFKKGLAYRKASLVNWCPSCKTVLADEQVIDGKCERCGTVTTRKQTEQWFFKITDYADRLLSGLDKINWPDKIKTAQRNWIGKKQGTLVTFKILGHEKDTITVFTTRLDTLRGVTFVVISPETAQKMIDSGWKAQKNIKNYIDKSLKKTEQQRQAEAGEKTGMATWIDCINPLTGDVVPVWVADYVLAGVGTGAVMGVPGYDERDFQFAKKFKLPTTKLPLDDEQKIFTRLKKQGAVKREKIYHLRDWLISRQRYWGSPIPMVKCDDCGWQPVPEKDLPVVLPYVKDYQPTGDGKSPLQKAPKDWLEVKCPNCGGKAKRETDVSDTFLDSSWYFLRYPSIRSARSGQVPWDPEITKDWLPVDAYIGGAEHAVLHLMYSRFTWMALQDWGYLPASLGPEPFPFLYSHGLLIKDGAKMSKTRGNVINPDSYIADFGADTLRMYLMFLGPYDHGGDFRDTGMRGMGKFLDRVWRLVTDHRDLTHTDQKNAAALLNKLHQTVKKVTLAMTDLRYNVAIANLMDLVNFLYDQVAKMQPIKGKIRCAEWEETLQKLTLMLAPMAPYISEEMWESLGGKFSVHQQLWPKYEESLTKSDTVTIVAQVNGKVRGEFQTSAIDAANKAKVIKRAYDQPRVKAQLKDKKVIKEIFVPGKLVNLVVN